MTRSCGVVPSQPWLPGVRQSRGPLGTGGRNKMAWAHLLHSSHTARQVLHNKWPKEPGAQFLRNDVFTYSYCCELKSFFKLEKNWFRLFQLQDTYWNSSLQYQITHKQNLYNNCICYVEENLLCTFLGGKCNPGRVWVCFRKVRILVFFMQGSCI